MFAYRTRHMIDPTNWLSSHADQICEKNNAEKWELQSLRKVSVKKIVKQNKPYKNLHYTFLEIGTIKKNDN